MDLNYDQNTYVLELYEESDKSPSRAIELFKGRFGRSVSSSTIRSKWRKERYELNPHGGHRHGLTDEEIRSLHGHCEGDMEKMVEKVNRESPKGLLKRCGILGLEVHNIPKTNGKESEPFPNYIV